MAIASNESFSGWAKTFTILDCVRSAWTGLPSADTAVVDKPADEDDGHGHHHH